MHADLKTIKKIVLEIFNIKEEELITKTRKRKMVDARAAFILLGLKYNYHHTEILKEMNNVISRPNFLHFKKTYQDIKFPEFNNKFEECIQRLGYGFEDKYYLSMGKL